MGSLLDHPVGDEIAVRKLHMLCICELLGIPSLLERSDSSLDYFGVSHLVDIE